MRRPANGDKRLSDESVVAITCKSAVGRRKSKKALPAPRPGRLAVRYLIRPSAGRSMPPTALPAVMIASHAQVWALP